MAPELTPRPKPPVRRSPFRRPLSPLYFGALLFGLLILGQLAASMYSTGQTLSYSEFKSLLSQGQVVEGPPPRPLDRIDARVDQTERAVMVRV